jgi:hypothetical protein
MAGTGSSEGLVATLQLASACCAGDVVGRPAVAKYRGAVAAAGKVARSLELDHFAAHRLRYSSLVLYGSAGGPPLTKLLKARAKRFGFWPERHSAERSPALRDEESGTVVFSCGRRAARCRRKVKINESCCPDTGVAAGGPS